MQRMDYGLARITGPWPVRVQRAAAVIRIEAEPVPDLERFAGEVYASIPVAYKAGVDGLATDPSAGNSLVR